MELEDGAFTLGTAEDEFVMYEFNSGAGEVTVVCTVPERVYVAQVPNERAALLGLALGIPLASAGILLLGIALTARRRTA